MTTLEVLLSLCIVILLIKIFIYNSNKKKILKSMLEDLWNLQETQDKIRNDFPKTYNNREGQIFQIKKIRNKLENL